MVATLGSSAAASIRRQPVTRLAASAMPVPRNAAKAASVVLTGVSCGSPTRCTAIGTYRDKAGATLGLIEVLVGPSWRAIDAPLPLNALHDPSVALYDISCPSARSCVVVGGYFTRARNQGGLLDTFSGGRWESRQALLPAGAPPGASVTLHAVTCASAASCVAVGSYRLSSVASAGLIESSSGQSWRAVRAPVPSNAMSGTGLVDYHTVELQAVSCFSPGACEAVGSYDAKEGARPARSEGLIESSSGGRWVGSEAPLPREAGRGGAQLAAVSCVKKGGCEAAGSFYLARGGLAGLLEAGDRQSWRASRAPTPRNAARTRGYVELGELSCPEPGHCVAAGSYRTTTGGSGGLLETLSRPSWRPLEAPLPRGARPGTGLVNGLSCSGWFCEVIGSYTNSAGDGEGLVEMTSAGRWVARRAPAPAQDHKLSVTLYGLSCGSSRFCVAAGMDRARGVAETARAVG